MLETRRGELPQVAPPPMPEHGMGQPMSGLGGAPLGVRIATPGAGTPILQHQGQQHYPQPQSGHAQDRVGPMSYQPAHMAPNGGATEVRSTAAGGNSKLVWWIVGLLVLGAGVGAVAAYFLA
jgi:hypothetical protein